MVKSRHEADFVQNLVYYVARRIAFPTTASGNGATATTASQSAMPAPSAWPPSEALVLDLFGATVTAVRVVIPQGSSCACVALLQDRCRGSQPARSGQCLSTVVNIPWAVEDPLVTAP